jgi:DNA-directed RNA polymerase specialized sigma24 family protein
MQKTIQNLLGDGETQRLSIEDIRSAMQKLPPDHCKAIELHFLQQLSRKQIANQLHWSLSKVNAKITRGITLLKYELNPSHFQKMDEVLAMPVIVSF